MAAFPGVQQYASSAYVWADCHHKNGQDYSDCQ